jgi:quercetin dioxygenase-like cupin family protein
MKPLPFARTTLTRNTLIILLLAGAAGALLAQAPGIRRTVIKKADVSVPGREAVVARVELDAGATAGRHTHPGDEISYVLEGEGELRIDGEDPRRVKAGESFVIPAGTVHDALNVGSGTLKLVGVYVVEKGKPLATAAK